LIYQVTSRRTVLRCRFVNDEVGIRVGAGLRSLQSVALRFVAIFEVLIGSEMESGRKIEILVSCDGNVKSSRLIHCQQNRTKHDGGRKCSDEYGDLLIFRRGSNKETGFEILRRSASIGCCTTDNSSNSKRGYEIRRRGPPDNQKYQAGQQQRCDVHA